VIRDASGYISEVGHYGFDGHALKRFRQHLDCFANQDIAVAERQDET
jgi:hypothetical protein